MRGRQGYYWSEQDVNAKLEDLLTRAFAAIWERSVTAKMPLKQAAFEVAIERMVRAMV